MLGEIKDRLTSTAAKSLIASRIERYGRLTELHIHSRERRLNASLILEGEESPIDIHISRYRIRRTEQGTICRIEALSASRTWMQRILEDLLLTQEFPISGILSMALGGSDPEEPAAPHHPPQA